MCGLVGVAGALNNNDEKAFKNLLFMDQLRGKDSTGVVHIDSALNPTIVKEAINANIFLEWTPFTRLMSRANNRAFIGHNRAATKGSVNSINAHPFQHGDIYGVHNGTLRNQSLLPDSTQYEVDSDNIYHSINTIGVDETVSKLCGAYALVWWDDTDDTINMVRNNERTLYYTLTATNKLYWASEAEMLECALNRNNIVFDEILSLPVDKHYKFKIKNGHTVFVSDVKLEAVREVSPYVAPKLPAQRSVYPYQGGRTTSHYRATSVTKNSHTSSVAEVVKSLGYNDISDICFIAEEAKDRDRNSGSLPISLLSTQGTSGMLRIVDIKKPDYQALVDHNGYFTAKSFRHIRQTDGKVQNLVIPYADVVLREWDEYLVDDSDDDIEFRSDNRGNLIDEKEFDRRYKTCSMCGDPMMFDDPLSLLTHHNAGICGNCNTNPANAEYISYVM